MNPEALILRRCFPVPVTFADLRAAFSTKLMFGHEFADAQDIRRDWTAALKEITGALDEVYAVVDGREVRVGLVADAHKWVYCGFWSDIGKAEDQVHNLLDASIKAGYWERPHEVRIQLVERLVSHDDVARAVLVGQQYVERKAVQS